jgi:hypothetical protein
MAWYDELLQGLGGAFGGSLGRGVMGGALDLLGLGGKPQEMPKKVRPAPQLDQTPMQAPQMPVPAPNPLPPQQGPMRGALQMPNMEAALQAALRKYTGGR